LNHHARRSPAAQQLGLVVLVRLEVPLAHAAGQDGLDLVRVAEVGHDLHRGEEVDVVRLLKSYTPRFSVSPLPERSKR
jgi:hypothetical protein